MIDHSESSHEEEDPNKEEQEECEESEGPTLEFENLQKQLQKSSLQEFNVERNQILEILVDYQL